MSGQLCRAAFYALHHQYGPDRMLYQYEKQVLPGTLHGPVSSHRRCAMQQLNEVQQQLAEVKKENSILMKDWKAMTEDLQGKKSKYED